MVDVSKSSDSNKPVFGDAWRIFRILSEFVDGFETMTQMGPSVSVFGSARVAPNHRYYQLSVEVSKKIAEKGFGIITGGGPGIMEGANKGAQEGKGRSCGVSINLPFEDEYNPFIDRKYRLSCRYFFVRKVMFVRYAQAFVFLPGGFGTLDELFEVLTLLQTNKIKEIPIFLMGSEYWKGMVDWLKNTSLKENYITQTDMDRIIVTDDPDFVATKIEEYFQVIGKAPTYDLGSGG